MLRTQRPTERKREREKKTKIQREYANEREDALFSDF